jgi:4-amino-4-deoxychorismate lyase
MTTDPTAYHAMSCRAVLINGQPQDPETASVSVFDRGFQYGDGVFETMASVAGRVRDRDRHLARLAQGARLLGIPEPEAGVLEGEVDRLGAGPTTAERAVIKVLYSRGPGGRGLAPPAQAAPTRVILCLAWPEHPRHWASQGVRTITCRTRQTSGAALDARIKSMNQLNHIVARMEWQDPDIAEGLLCDERGRLVEGTVTNLFARFGERLVTPDLAGAGLPGITRGRIMELARAEGWQVAAGELTPAELADADEAFLTNSVVGLWPVREHDGRALASSPGPAARSLGRALEAAYA